MPDLPQPPRKQSRRRRGRPEKPYEPKPEHLAMYTDHCAGKSARRLARKYHCSITWINTCVKKIDAWFADAYVGRIREIKANHTQRLEYIYCEAMAAWRRSQEDAESETVADIEAGKFPGTNRTKTKRGQVGASQFLTEARAAIHQIREIWGANAPLVIEHAGEVRVAGRPIDECRSELLERVNRITSAIGRN